MTNLQGFALYPCLKLQINNFKKSNTVSSELNKFFNSMVANLDSISEYYYYFVCNLKIVKNTV